jgi:SSS family solute:Na+ symporter
MQAMHMTWIDWAVVAAVITLFTTMAVIANRLTRSVSDYLVAGRCAGRYMLTMASGMEWIGAINIVAMFQVYYTGGFPCMWWVMLSTPFIVYMCVSGWGVYRFRETRSMTIAQFLETRYSRKLRLMAGILSWLAGMINFGIFPAVSARLFMSIIGLPEHFHLGGIEISTFVVLTGLMVVVPLGFIVMGGHTSVMVSNFMQGLFTNVAAVIIVTVLFFTVFDWNAIVQCLIKGGTANASLLDPIHASGTKDFNAWYFIIGIVGGWYCAMSNVPSQAFLGSGKTAHEQRMGYLLGQISWQGLLVFFMMIALCSFKLMHDPADAAVATQITEAMKSVPAEVHDQTRVTATLPALLPVGFVGLFCAIMMAALISSHNGFMHAWGGVLLQDIILPFRKQPLSTKAHLWALRGAIATVGVIAFVYSLFWKPNQSLLMYFAMVNNVWLGPAGAVMIGGLYWKKGTTRAAVTTLAFGAVLGIVHIVLRWGWNGWTGQDFPLNSQWVFLITILFSVLLYATVSWLDNQPAFNMDKMLYRGIYATKGEKLPELRPTRWWQTIFGITPLFNRRDRLTAYLIVGYFLAWLGVFAIGMVYGFLADPGQEAWAKFWRIYLYFSFALLVGSTFWLGIGGLRDLKNLLHNLRSTERDFADDGSVKTEAAVKPLVSPLPETAPIPEQRTVGK